LPAVIKSNRPYPIDAELRGLTIAASSRAT
jgi:hypothetical protein